MAPLIYNHLPKIMLESESIRILLDKSYYKVDDFLRDKIKGQITH